MAIPFFGLTSLKEILRLLCLVGTISEVNTPSPCDTVDKQIIVNEAVMQLKSSPVETEHVEKVEMPATRTVLSIQPPEKVTKEKLENEVEAVALTNGTTEGNEETKQEEPEVNKKNEQDLDQNEKLEAECSNTNNADEDGNGEPPREEHESNVNGTNEEAEDGNCEASEAQLSNGQFVPEVDGLNMDESNGGGKSLDWSDAIDLSDNNNVEKTESAVLLDPFGGNGDEPSENYSPRDSKSSKASSPKSPVSASNSQVSSTNAAVSRNQSASKQPKVPPTSTSSKAHKSNDRKPARTPPSGKAHRGKDLHSSATRKGRQISEDKGKHNEDWNGGEEDAANWGNQAGALPNGFHSDSHSEVTFFLTLHF